MKQQYNLQSIYETINKSNGWYSFEITFYCLLIVVLAFVPQAGFITIGGITMSFLSVFVIVAAIRRGYFAGILTGLVYGIVTFIVATLARNLQIYFPTGLYFINCHVVVAILPRVLLGFFTAFLYKTFKIVFKNVWFIIPIVSTVNLLVYLFFCISLAFVFYSKMLNNLYGDNAFIKIIFYRKNYFYLVEVLFNSIISTSICFLISSLVRKKTLFES